MHKMKLHHDEELDGKFKGSWRPSLVATLYGVDGQPVAWKEIVVFTCPSCGCPQGFGADGDEIVEGKSERIIKCQDSRCGWADMLEFDDHQKAKGRERYGKIKAEAEEGVKQARINHLHDKIRNEMQADMNERALAEAKKIMAAGGDPQEIFRSHMAKKKITPEL